MQHQTLTHHGAHKVVVCVDLEVVLEVGLAQKHSVAVLVRTAELLRLLFVDLRVLPQLLLGGERLVTSME